MARVVVTVRWGETVLVSREIARGRDASIGVGADSVLPIPCAALGVAEAKIAAVRGDVPVAIVPEGAIAFHERRGSIPAPVTGPAEVALGAGETVSFPIDTFLITVCADPPEELPWAGRPRLRAALAPGACAAVAAAVHAFVLVVSAQSARADTSEREPAVEEMSRYLAAAEARSAANETVVAGHEGNARAKWVDGRDGNGAASGGARAAGTEGTMGSASQRGSADARYSVARGGEKAERGIARADALADARSFGMIGVLSSEGSRSPFVSFGAAAAAGLDSIGARGDMWGTSIGETFGSGGLGLSGIGEGGGGRYEGIGLALIGIGFGDAYGIGTGGRGSGSVGQRTWGTGGYRYTGNPCSFGYGVSLAGCSHRRSSFALVNYGTPSVRALMSGTTPPDPLDYMRVARQAGEAFKSCYRPLVEYDPDSDRMEGPVGTVVTSVVIDESGGVLTAGNSSSTFPSPQVAACVATAFRGLQFPSREGAGSVGAHFPLRFSWKEVRR